MDLHPRRHCDCGRRRCFVLDFTGLTAISKLAKALGAAIHHSSAGVGLWNQRRPSADVGRLSMALHQSCTWGLENLAGRHYLLGEFYPAIWFYLCRSEHHPRPRIYQRRSSAIDGTGLLRWRLFHSPVRLAIRPTPDQMAFYHHPIHHRLMRLRRPPSNPTPSAARPHLRLPLRNPRRSLPTHHRHPQLGRQQPGTHVETLRRNGAANLHRKSRRRNWF